MTEPMTLKRAWKSFGCFEKENNMSDRETLDKLERLAERVNGLLACVALEGIICGLLALWVAIGVAIK